MGYGLTDVKTRGYKIADGRINRKSIFLDGRKWEKLYAEETIDDYLDWINDRFDKQKFLEGRGDLNMDMWLRKDNGWYTEGSRNNLHMSDVFWYANEYGMKNVLLLKPLGMKEWSRYDDMLDWVEETYVRDPEGENGANWVKVLDDGIFPYNGTYMDARTGERIRDGITLRRILQSNVNEWKWDTIEEDYGFKSMDDIRENLVPFVPQEIRDIAEWGQLFTNDNVWKQLRPMIYVYWS